MLMYGSSFMFATLSPRFSRSAPIDALARPLPRDETTPPVTKMNLVCLDMLAFPGNPYQKQLHILKLDHSNRLITPAPLVNRFPRPLRWWCTGTTSIMWDGNIG